MCFTKTVAESTFRIEQTAERNPRYRVWPTASASQVPFQPSPTKDHAELQTAWSVSCSLLFVSRFCSAFQDRQTKKSSSIRRQLRSTVQSKRISNLLSGHHWLLLGSPRQIGRGSANIPLGTQTLSCEPHTSSETPPKRRRRELYYSGRATKPSGLSRLSRLTRSSRLPTLVCMQLLDTLFPNLLASHSICQSAAHALSFPIPTLRPRACAPRQPISVLWNLHHPRYLSEP